MSFNRRSLLKMSSGGLRVVSNVCRRPALSTIIAVEIFIVGKDNEKACFNNPLSWYLTLIFSDLEY